MIPMTLAEVARMTRGRIAGCPDPTAIVIDAPVVTDSREATPGSLYVARIGEHADGHTYAAAARDRGAVAALTSREIEDLPCVVVADVQGGFAAIAREVIARAEDLTVIGVTGSSGKTSTKDLLAAVLRTAGPTVAPIGSYNSEVGVPLTVVQVTGQTRFLIVEMGARALGHITYLTEIAPPHIGVVLNVGSAHVGEFGSREAIAAAKAELVAALPPDGVAVLNADDPVVRAMSAHTRARVVLVGESANAQVRAENVVLDDHGRARFDAVSPDGRARVELAHLVGRHHVGNALSVLAVAEACGLDLGAAASALADAAPVSRWRMEVTRRPDGVTVVNDAYNANPDSMRAALAAIGAMRIPGRRFAVLGSMLELGAESEAGHAAVGAEAVRLGIDHLIVVGEVAAPIATGAEQAAAERGGGGIRIRQVPDAGAAEAILRAELADGDLALFKSSRDAGLRFLGERIAAPEPGTPEEDPTP